eukprot:3704126-Alexandrium_andersonii.AAC.1
MLFSVHARSWIPPPSPSSSWPASCNWLLLQSSVRPTSLHLTWWAPCASSPPSGTTSCALTCSASRWWYQ